VIGEIMNNLKKIDYTFKITLLLIGILALVYPSSVIIIAVVPIVLGLYLGLRVYSNENKKEKQLMSNYFIPILSILIGVFVILSYLF
jgi:hypothetical protein